MSSRFFHTCHGNEKNSTGHWFLMKAIIEKRRDSNSWQANEQNSGSIGFDKDVLSRAKFYLNAHRTFGIVVYMLMLLWIPDNYNAWQKYVSGLYLITRFLSPWKEKFGKSINWCVHVRKEKNRYGHKISAWLELYEGTCRIYGLYPTRTIT